MLTLRDLERVERFPEQWRVRFVANRDGRERRITVELAEGGHVLDVQADDGLRCWNGGAGTHRLTEAAISGAREEVARIRAFAKVTAEERGSWW